MIKNTTTLFKEIDGKSFLFMADADSSLGSVYDAISYMMAIVVEKINLANQQAAKPENKEGQNDSCNSESSDCS